MKTAQERKAERIAWERKAEAEAIDTLRAKPCIICENVDMNSIRRVDACSHLPEISLTCKRCELAGPYGDRSQREETLYHKVGTLQFWVDGGEPSTECKNFSLKMQDEP